MHLKKGKDKYVLSEKSRCAKKEFNFTECTNKLRGLFLRNVQKKISLREVIKLQKSHAERMIPHVVQAHNDLRHYRNK